MPIRIPPLADVVPNVTVVPRNLPNNRPPAVVRPDWSETPRVARTWGGEITASAILAQEQRVGRRARPRLKATSLHHGTNQEETAWVLDMLLSASPQLIIPLLDRAELSAPLDYTWPFVIAADEISIDGTAVSLGGGLTRFTFQTAYRRFQVGARLWIYSSHAPPNNQIQLDLRRLPGVLLTIDDIQTGHIDVLLDLPASNITFPASGLVAAPAFDAAPLYEIQQEYPSCSHARVEIEGVEYPGGNQYPALNDGDVSSLYDYFLGDPVWKPDHNWAQKLNTGLQRTGGNTDSGRGFVSVLSGLNPRMTLEVSSLLLRDAWWSILQLFDSRQGILKSLWVVTDAAIFERVILAAPTTSVTDLPQRGYETHLTSLIDAVAFLRADGSFELAQVDNITYDNILGTFTLDTVQTIPAGTYTKVLIAFRGGFVSDELEEVWETCDLVKSEFVLIQRGPESDLSI